VAFFFKRLFESGRDLRALGHVKTAAIGPATAEKLLEFGLRTDILPESYRAEAIIAAFEPIDIKGRRILLPRAREARPILPAELVKRGADVDEIGVYGTRPVSEGAGELIQQLENKQIDLVTFTSSSTATNFKYLLPQDRFEELIQDVTVASIGPITSETAAKLGFEVHITAAEYTIPGLVSAILAYYAST
jgi:uroporphyrinogen III methyltransferase/synthase